MSLAIPLSLLLAAPLNGVTVFAGDQPEPFTAEVLDTLPHALGPRVPLILVRLRGKKIEHTGVIAGMSGSPVYQDGRLIGAVGYRMGSFSKEPIAGITPIDHMRQALTGQVRAGKASHNLQNVQVPVVIAGLDASVSKPLLDELSQATATPLRAVAGGGSSSGPAPDQLVNGGALAVVMAKGDINMFALGTVTEVDEKSFLGFGHPMFGWGALAIPVGTAVVSTTIASPANAFKVGRLGKLVGTMTQDRLPAIGGTIGTPAPMIPVTIDVGEAQPFKVDLAIHRRLTPSLLRSVAHQAALRRTDFDAGGTVGLTGMLETSHGSVKINEWVAHPHHPGTGGAVAEPLRWISAMLLDNPLGSVTLKSAKLKLHRLPTTHVEALRTVEILNPNPQPGQPLDLRLRWRRYQDTDRHQDVSLPLSNDLEAGPAQLVVAGGGSIDSLERHCGDGAPPRSQKELVPWLNDRADPRARALFVVRAIPTQSFGSQRMMRSAWDERLPRIDLDSEPGGCLIVARHDLAPAAGPVVADQVLSFSLQGAR